jgi:predicted dehydrogenase
MTDDAKVRIGFVGTGRMGQCAHLRNYALLDECRVVALAEIKKDLGAEVARRYGVPKVYTCHREMLDKEALDGIVCCQPYERHGVLLPEIARRGLPLFTEKPLASSIATGERILRALREHNCRHMLGYHKRSDPAVEYAQREIRGLKESGELGELRYVRMLVAEGGWIAGGYDTFIESNEAVPDLERDPAPADMDEETLAKYAYFVNVFVHQVNLVRHLLGEPYKVTYADPSGVLLAGQSESGIPCAIEMSPYYTTVNWQESVLVAFGKGYVRIELPAPLAVNRPGRVEVLRDPGGRAPEVTTPHLPWVHAMKNQALNFTRFVRGAAPAPCGPEEALEDLKVAREYIRLLTGK